MLDAYQALDYASFLLGAQGCVIRHNAKAERLLGNGLELSKRVLRCFYPDDTLALRNAIATSSGSLHAKPIVVVAKRPVLRPLIIQTMGLTGLAGAVFSQARTMLVVTDPGAPVTPTPVDYAQKAFGLTLAEGRLTGHLEQGLSLAMAAEVMNISVETARSHLKRVFAKIDTARQTDLTMLMTRLKSGN